MAKAVANSYSHCDCRRVFHKGAGKIKQMNPFQLNVPFLKQLWTQLSIRKNDVLDSFPDSQFFPNVRQLKILIETMMWASVQFEEGRVTPLRVSFSEPMPFEHLGLVFRESKELNVQELRKLAPAVLPPDGQIGVWPLGRGKKLRVWGLQTNNLHGTTFESIAPGRLVIRFVGRFAIAVIDGNEAGFISKNWNDRCANLFYGAYAHDVTPRGLARGFFWSQVTEEILRRIRLLKHGGTLLLITDTNHWRASVDPLFYECERHLDKVRPISTRLNLELQKVDAKDDPGTQRLAAIRFAIDLNHSDQVAISDAARAITYLSSIDGATILDVDFRVLAFGAKIRPAKVKASLLAQVIVPLDDGPIRQASVEEEFRGTRHQSAARFVSNNPGSRAFVVSQDGGVTGIGWSSDNKGEQSLTIYKGLELLL